MINIKSQKRFIAFLFAFLFILLLFIFVSVSMGSATDIGFKQVVNILYLKTLSIFGVAKDINNSNAISHIIFNIRLPRVIAACIIGAALSVCGTIYQGALKNPMADPYILGISSGAAFGATLAIVLSNKIDIKISAFVFSLLIAIIVYYISKKSLNKGSTALILTGININYFVTALISLLMILNKNKLDRIVFWTMGSLALNNWNDVLLLVYFVLPVVVAICFLGKYLNIMSFNEDIAKNVGINTAFIRKIIILAVSFIMAVCVSVSGTIGFIGLMVPHLTRIIFGNNYKFIIPFSGIIGSIFLLLSDDISKMAMIPSEIPIGIITSIIGAPFLIYLIFKANKRI